jgi:hypothetical protein
MARRPPRAHDGALSPNEQLALRVIALGVLEPEKLRARDLARLAEFGLIEQRHGRTVLTESGKQRHQAMEDATRERK